MGNRGAGDDRRLQPPRGDPESGAAPDRSGDLDGGRVQLHAGATGIRVRPDVHQLGEQDDREFGSPDRAGPGRRVPLGGAHGGRAVHEHPVGDYLQRIYRPLHPRLHDGSGEGIVDAVRTFYGGGVMRTRMPSFCTLSVLAVFMLGGSRTSSAQQVVKFGEGQTLTISGFISATMFYDHGLFGSFGQGQNAEFAAAPAAQPTTDKSIFDGDVQPQLRVRFAFVDLSNGRTTLRIGQFWSPMFGEVPVSLTHLAFPLGYGATGMVGWRFPGVFLYQDLSAAGAPLTVQLQLAAFKGSGPPGSARDSAATVNVGNGEASGLPQFEARLYFAKKTPNLSWSAYVVGHLDWKDTTGTGRDTTNTGAQDSNMSAWGIEAGGNIAPGKLTLHGNFYYGKALGQQFAHITQFAKGHGESRVCCA